MSFFLAVAMHLAAAQANADPVGPNGTPENVSPYESDPVKGWWDATWTNPDETAYIQLTEDNQVSIARTWSPGTTDSSVGGSAYWTWAELLTGDVYIRYSKNGQYSSWVQVGLA